MIDKDKKRILIFNVNWLGDVLFSTPVIRNVRKNYPDSFIACVVPSRCYQVLKGNPHLDEIIVFDEKDRHRGVLAKISFARRLKEKGFNLVFLLHRSFRRALLCRIAGIPERIGHLTPKRAFLLTKKIHPPKRDACHRIDFYLDVIQQAGLRVEDRHLEFFFSGEDMESVRNFLTDSYVGSKDYVVVLNPGGNWLPKRWPPENWAMLADRLILEKKAKVVITGSVSDVALASEIKSLMKQEPIIACGRLNLKQLAALAQSADIFITADTGPLHIANAVGAKKIVALFGPTSPSITGPFPAHNAVVLFEDVGCKVPCYQLQCKDNRCMKAITPEKVFESIR